MNGVLHQLSQTSQRRACLARCKSGDAVLLMGPAAVLARSGALDVPADIEVFALRTDLGQHAESDHELNSDVQVIEDAQWVALAVRFSLNLTW